MTYTVAALYRFVPITNPSALRLNLKTALADLDLCGSLLVASEGINATIAGSQVAIEKLLQVLDDHVGLPSDNVKFSESPVKPFNRFKIRLKREIITFKQPKANPSELSGIYVLPLEWNKLISDPEVVVIDTRNLYETAIGTFEKALIPEINHFSEFADYVRTHLDPTKHKKIAMFCTGGIRCEKASSFMLSEGFPEVYHLKGGILKYLEEVSPHETKWHGECYVFDKRMALGQGLSTGHYTMCFCCGAPLSQEDKGHSLYEEGVSCASCFDVTSEDDKVRFRTRHHQLTKQYERSKTPARDYRTEERIQDVVTPSV